MANLLLGFALGIVLTNLAVALFINLPSLKRSPPYVEYDGERDGDWGHASSNYPQENDGSGR